jgi:hypothetical protein
LDAELLEEAIRVLEPLFARPPFSRCIVECICDIVGRISSIESKRDGLTRADRSALDPVAQPLQDLLDDIVFRLAGLTDVESEGLERRLSEML